VDLIALLAPQERAAVILKDVFDFSLDEIADALTTSVGAVKAALQRGRGKLVDPEPARVATAVPAVVDAFCAAFNARDIDGLTALLLDSAIVEAPGLSVEYGAQTARKGSLAGILFGDPSSDRCGIAPAYRVGALPRPPRARAPRRFWRAR
jgi:RNA polymerase sigma-70 factor (ECF subfamily)